MFGSARKGISDYAMSYFAFEESPTEEAGYAYENIINIFISLVLKNYIQRRRWSFRDERVAVTGTFCCTFCNLYGVLVSRLILNGLSAFSSE